MDLDVEMIRMASKHLSPAQRSRIQLYAGDIEHLPYEDNTMDAVFDFGVLHHIPDWRNALAEVTRVLKVGGILFLEELYPSLYQNFITKHLLLHPTEDRFGGDDLRTAAAAANLTIKDSLELKLAGILAVLVKER